ncbi:unnamed protein product [Pseudo-nitzschia multistriata]|uniref:Uncharacterized protein n=1 Tax=Pseudo-nitzschia multistriata TaxID=183589 RepID=A0A448ZHM9_9STRA|nr:unnamed protein product [Pseudo-nitzschia multistriata]
MFDVYCASRKHSAAAPIATVASTPLCFEAAPEVGALVGGMYVALVGLSVGVFSLVGSLSLVGAMVGATVGTGSAVGWGETVGEPPVSTGRPVTTTRLSPCTQSSFSPEIIRGASVVTVTLGSWERQTDSVVTRTSSQLEVSMVAFPRALLSAGSEIDPAILQEEPSLHDRVVTSPSTESFELSLATVMTRLPAFAPLVPVTSRFTSEPEKTPTARSLSCSTPKMALTEAPVEAVMD